MAFDIYDEKKIERRIESTSRRFANEKPTDGENARENGESLLGKVTRRRGRKSKENGSVEINDIEAYKKLLAEAAKTKESIEGYPAGVDGEGEGTKYEALQEFLAETEGYLEKLGGKIASVKISQARSEAATEAAAQAAAEGLDEDEIKEAAEKAAREATEQNGQKMISQTKEDGIQNTEKYYAVAHSEQEIITTQPKMLTFGQLRDYQIVSLQWMVSLHNNRLNGILADEMGLGKTVQVCSLIAYPGV